MAIVVIGRGIDISLVAVLAVPPGLVLQMVQDGHSLPVSLAAALALALAFGLVNGWLIAYAEVPSLFTTLASGLFLAGLGQVALFQLDVVQWSPRLDGFEWLGQGTLLGMPMPVVMFAHRLRRWSPSSCGGRGSAPTSMRSATTRSARASPASRRGR